ncbi:NUDIX domain-containing protein [Paenibacillus arenilitoris]|uniref:NUDIX domain-containing protein n=1 Tax=Paenibacillus arenilitoris TaxID=2772299 RepID=A0A927H5K9_9BACL|nr:NUDIX domain-containing protein [Paenibacillus arenilitoris]MBD2867664.1 NUDIX domain-containing protein [Paenibacillus arenilitoris]
MMLRQMAVAWIRRDGCYAMIKKKRSKLADFEFWAALGGHMEPHEIGNPREACLREIYEESGLRESDLHELALRYVLIRRKDREIRIQYVFFGSTDKAALTESDEGELHWVDEDKIGELKTSAIVKEMYMHYRNHADAEHAFVGTITGTADGKPMMQWAVLTDPGVF